MRIRCEANDTVSEKSLCLNELKSRLSTDLELCKLAIHLQRWLMRLTTFPSYPLLCLHAIRLITMEDAIVILLVVYFWCLGIARMEAVLEFAIAG